MILGDFDADGKLDIIASGCNTDCTGNELAFLRGNGDGTFQPPQDFDIPLDPTSLAAADFNGDGRLDLAVGSVAILLGNGDGTFQPPVEYDTGTAGFPILIADFNGDGKLDLAIPTDNDTVALLLGNGDGTFQARQDIVAGCCRAGIGDFNADGKPDLVVEANGLVPVQNAVLLNIADIPGFTFSIDLTGTGTGAVTVAPGFVCTNSCSHDYAKGANLTLTAEANTGSTFSGWTGGGCSGTGACNITITTNTSVTAAFDITPDFSISASALSPGSVSPGQSATSTISCDRGRRLQQFCCSHLFRFTNAAARAAVFYQSKLSKPGNPSDFDGHNCWNRCQSHFSVPALRHLRCRAAFPRSDSCQRLARFEKKATSSPVHRPLLGCDCRPDCASRLRWRWRRWKFRRWWNSRWDLHSHRQRSVGNNTTHHQRDADGAISREVLLFAPVLRLAADCPARIGELNAPRNSKFSELFFHFFARYEVRSQERTEGDSGSIAAGSFHDSRL